MDAFRTGGGVPYEAYRRDTLEGDRPGQPADVFVSNDYAAQWIPRMPDAAPSSRKREIWRFLPGNAAPAGGYAAER